MRKLAFAFILLSLCPVQVLAEDGALGIVTGSATGTNIRMAEDIAKIAGGQGIKIDVKESRGSIDNIRRMSSKENATLGIVQSDVLGYLSRVKDKTISKSVKDLRMVFPLHSEEVHLLAKSDIKTFADLKNRSIVVGSEGSGTWLTSMNLLAMQGVMPKNIIRAEPAEGLTMLLTGKTDAMFYVGGKPLKLFRNLEDVAKVSSKEGGENPVEQIHLVPLNDPKMLKEYKAAEITPADYSFVKENVPTIGVTAVLMSFDFANYGTEYAKKRCAEIGKVANIINANLTDLRETGHAKWKEVNPETDIKFWQKDACAKLDSKNALAPQSDMEKKLLHSIQQRW